MTTEKPENHPVFIVSGGAGISGNQVLNTVLVQFPDSNVQVFTVGNVRRMAQVEEVVARAHADGGTIVHTMVEARLRDAVNRVAYEHNVVAIDLMGHLMTHLARVLNAEPAGRPGLYRQLHQDYFDRVEAIEFTMAHDDGKQPDGWSQADIVLTGISRLGKTPLSMYLAVLGWKVANAPLVMSQPPPPELTHLDARRVIGLTMEPGQLVAHRRERQRRLGVVGMSAYADPIEIFEEVDAANKFFKKNGFAIIDVTDKPIETSADEVIKLITRRT